ncbi:LexA family protein [Methylophilus glucosoxydans]|uniref:LexA family protein n=1 Tax=Methylophilus glucosoxydans TaxID=752553 RepID=A0ABW3GFZ2_9PROT
MSDEKLNRKGGKRPGAGRKVGFRINMEETTVVRIFKSQKEVVGDLVKAHAKKLRLSQIKDSLDSVGLITRPKMASPPIELPAFESKVPAGLPSPADEHLEGFIDVSGFMIDEAENTFIVTIQGESMIEVGLMPGDKAIVVKGKQASLGDIVLVMVDGEFTVKTLSKQPNGLPKLLPENSSGKYAPILITNQMEFEITGVVTGSFRRFK